MLDMRTKKAKSKTVFYCCDDGGSESWQKGKHSMGNFVPETIVLHSYFQ